MIGDRRLHAGAWWLWAACLAAAATLTTNPLLLGMILAVVALVVSACRRNSRFAGGFGAFLWIAGAVVVIRILFRVVLGGDFGDDVLASIPVIFFPEWAGTFELGGPVTVEELLAGAYDGLRLATILVCIGAANTLADPRRLVGSLPRSLAPLASALVVALTVAPQLIEVVGRVRRARALRGERRRGWRGVRSLLVPVLEDTMSRSLALAASMESRGHGRAAAAAGTARFGFAAIGLFGIGSFAVLVSPPLGVVGAVLATAGLTGAAWTMRRLGRGVARTRYRPDSWGGRAWLVSAAGLTALAGVAITGLVDPGMLAPAVDPPAFPALPAAAGAGILAGAAPALATGPVPAARPIATGAPS